MLLLAIVIPLLGATLMGFNSTDRLLWWIGLAVVLIGLAVVVRQWRWAMTPRLALQDDHLLLYGGSGKGHLVRLPLEDVECFFFGKTDSHLTDRTGEKVPSHAVVIRIRERASQWQSGPLQPSLGTWGEGYVTLRGTWCEPLTVEKVRQMNATLAAVKRDRKKRQARSETT